MNARTYACEVLYRVIYENSYASLLMRSMPEDFSAEDRGLISEIVYGTLRNCSLLELQWSDLAQGRVRSRTRVLLNAAVYQLKFMDRIPSYAVISESVSAAKKQEKGFVNAVLRAVDRRPLRHAEGEWPQKDAIETSHPVFLLKLWEKQYGRETAEKILAADQERPVVYGRLNTLKADDSFFHAEGIERLENDCFIWNGNLAASSWLKDGTVLIQSRTSQRVIPLLDAKPGMRVLDVCAAPGTKTQQIACAMKNMGEIVAGDLYPERVKLIDQLMKRTGATIVRAAVRNAEKRDETMTGRFDRVLVDAPCSGLGDLSHKPEIRLHVSPESIDELTGIQARILAASASCVKPGGVLVYSTCTLNRKENERQIRMFLEENHGFSLLEEHTFFPFELKSDGFYAAKLVRVI